MRHVYPPSCWFLSASISLGLDSINCCIIFGLTKIITFNYTKIIQCRNYAWNYILIDGYVEGNVTAIEGIELLNKSKVIGDLTTNILSINEGAIFKGKSLMVEKQEETEVSLQEEENNEK